MFRVLLTTFVALTLCGCASRPAAKSREVAKLGKIIIQYRYEESDLKNPPAFFDVLRSGYATGGFVRINGSPIPADPKPTIGTIQELWTDKELPMGATYYYYIERIDGAGRHAKATSVAAAQVVLPMTGKPSPKRESTTVAK